MGLAPPKLLIQTVTRESGKSKAACQVAGGTGGGLNFLMRMVLTVNAFVLFKYCFTSPRISEGDTQTVNFQWLQPVKP